MTSEIAVFRIEHAPSGVSGSPKRGRILQRVCPCRGLSIDPAPCRTGNVKCTSIAARPRPVRTFPESNVRYEVCEGRANGTFVHFCGLVLDPQAPNGIVRFTDRHAFVADVIP